MELKNTSTLQDKLTVYLGGPINGRSDEDCIDWREKVIKSLPQVNARNPMDRDYRGKELEPGVDAEIVENDKLDIMQSEIVMIYFDQPSVGTSMEIMYAFERSKYILLVDASEKKLSPWLTYHASMIVSGLDEAIDVIRKAAEQYNVYEVGVWGDEEMD